MTHVFPQPESTDIGDGYMARTGAYAGGLSKRELFAAMAMQGMMAFGEWPTHEQGAIQSVKAADALLAELAKGGE